MPVHCALVGPGAKKGYWKAKGSDLGGEFPRWDDGNRRGAEGTIGQQLHAQALSISSLTGTFCHLCCNTYFLSQPVPSTQGFKQAAAGGPSGTATQKPPTRPATSGYVHRGLRGVRGWVGPAWASFLRDDGQPSWALTWLVWHAVCATLYRAHRLRGPEAGPGLLYPTKTSLLVNCQLPGLPSQLSEPVFLHCPRQPSSGLPVFFYTVGCSPCHH